MATTAPFKRQMFRPTTDSWYGNFAIAGDARFPYPNLVLVSFFKELSGAGWRVTVWGNDDMGMEKSFSEDQYGLGVLAYTELSLCEAVDRDLLTRMGFVPA